MNRLIIALAIGLPFTLVVYFYSKYQYLFENRSYIDVWIETKNKIDFIKIHKAHQGDNINESKVWKNPQYKEKKLFVFKQKITNAFSIYVCYHDKREIKTNYEIFNSDEDNYVSLNNYTTLNVKSKELTFKDPRKDR